MLTWLFFLTTLFIAGYAWLLKSKYQRLLTIADDGAKIVKSAFESTALGMAVVGPDLKYIDINKAYGEIVGYTREELFKMIHKDFIHPEDQELDTPNLMKLNSGKIDSFRSIKRYIHKEGHIVWGEATVSVVRDEKGKPKYYVTQIQDITLAKKTEEELRQSRDQAEILACTDFLTDCLNRRAFILRLEEELERSKRSQSQTAMILVDIDSFKRVNDQFGHLAGDYVLQQFSTCIKKSIRSYDFIGRYGGEEFMICLPETDGENATMVAERMRVSLEKLEINFQGAKIKITGSFGVVNYDCNRIESINQLITKADKAMYRAKKHKNTVYQMS